MSKYIGSIDNYKNSIVFTYINDMQRVYELFKKKDISLSSAYDLIKSRFNYLQGFLYGLDVKHINNFLRINGKTVWYVSFFSDSSRKTKYSISFCPDISDFSFKYTRKERK